MITGYVFFGIGTLLVGCWIYGRFYGEKDDMIVFSLLPCLPYMIAFRYLVGGFYGLDLDQFWISSCVEYQSVRGFEYEAYKLGAEREEGGNYGRRFETAVGSRSITPGYANHTVGMPFRWLFL